MTTAQIIRRRLEVLTDDMGYYFDEFQDLLDEAGAFFGVDIQPETDLDEKLNMAAEYLAAKMKDKEKDSEIKEISPDEMSEVIRDYSPRGLFLTKEGGAWVACDNTSGDAWTEDFETREDAVGWLACLY